MDHRSLSDMPPSRAVSHFQGEPLGYEESERERHSQHSHQQPPSNWMGSPKMMEEGGRPGLSHMPTMVDSAASSILDEKEGHGGKVDIYDPKRPKLGLRERMNHFTWAWYTLPMSTGGLSLLIFAQPHKFPGLLEIGLFVYILNIIIFSLITSAMVSRFFLHPGSFRSSVQHPREGFFFPTFFLSIATLITSTERYAVPDDSVSAWGIKTAFWAYVALTLCVAVGQYSFVFASHNFELKTMMPTWILPIFPIMLSGTIASVIAERQPHNEALSIVIAGTTCQGLGMLVAMMMYSHMVGRLMAAGLPNREHRPGLFMNVGPPSFTALAMIGMAKGIPDSFDVELDGTLDAPMIRTFAIIMAIFLWALALWWFCIALIAVLSSGPQYFHLGWWAMVFPNTGWILATSSIANELHSEPITWVVTGMSICLLLTYLFVFYSHVRAVLVQDIMYPGRDEDVNDH